MTHSDAPEGALDLPGYARVYSGKVRELYAPLDADGTPSEEVILLVASDRISAYDYVLDSVIPDKGRVLTQLSLWWFEQFASLVPDHVLSTDVPAEVEGRAILVRRLPMLPVECIGRAYLTGSGLAEYRERGSVCGVELPEGLTEASPFPEPIFTPTTKAPLGEHDQPMTYAQVEAEIGPELAAAARDMTTRILALGNEIAAERGILIADTKVEFGVRDGGLVLADEVLTPDSSRFWRAAEHEVGRPQTSYDKQYVRDWLTSPESGWDRGSGEAPPALPQDVVDATRATYVTAYEAITGRSFD
ncbi:phosphoribosylaminoimidazolesuccinocarboxamide synthase [Mobilicoccus pelagius]|uniref:Phosphoribosylaminoimidazole-succinocarboxamide synthase n=1 Tax=Mobilicoccus pelagius NBRC 104925 TaxID=1089455 RepID=H5UUH4_9MICO|nr:phosphoribosylaminoimidazolesuccinocarboxamide synthase [Mobilicoccus pelagius]GAB49382.1 phosphoribosylaminoimidazole-succinocarboxamide synthase [Mobilicoccus pelagius NBRC 104925]